MLIARPLALNTIDFTHINVFIRGRKAKKFLTCFNSLLFFFLTLRLLHIKAKKTNGVKEEAFPDPLIALFKASAEFYQKVIIFQPMENPRVN